MEVNVEHPNTLLARFFETCDPLFTIERMRSQVVDFDRNYFPLLQFAAAYVQRLPASRDFYSRENGLLTHIIRTAGLTLSTAAQSLLTEDAAWVRRRDEQAYALAAFAASVTSLLHLAHKNVIVTNSDGEIWLPTNCPLNEWCARYIGEWRDETRNSNVLAVFIATRALSSFPHVFAGVSPGVLDALIPSLDPYAASTGRDHVVQKIVRNAITASIEIDRKENGVAISVTSAIPLPAQTPIAASGGQVAAPAVTEETTAPASISGLTVVEPVAGQTEPTQTSAVTPQATRPQVVAPGNHPAAAPQINRDQEKANDLLRILCRLRSVNSAVGGQMTWGHQGIEFPATILGHTGMAPPSAIKLLKAGGKIAFDNGTTVGLTEDASVIVAGPRG